MLTRESKRKLTAMAPPSRISSGVLERGLTAYSCGDSHGLGRLSTGRTVFPFNPEREPSREAYSGAPPRVNKSSAQGSRTVLAARLEIPMLRRAERMPLRSWPFVQ